MRKISLSLGIIGLIFFIGCSIDKEVEFPLDISVNIVEKREATGMIPIITKIGEPYRENIKFTGELSKRNYVFTNRVVNIRVEASTKASVLLRSEPLEKMELLSIIEGENLGGNLEWYKIIKDEKIGYIHSSVGVVRRFEFKKMVKEVRVLEEFIEKSNENGESIERIISYIPGSSEKEGAPRDKYGNRGEQSILALYRNQNKKESFRYLQDGRIVSVNRKENINENRGYVKIPDSKNSYEIDLNRTTKIFSEKEEEKEGITRVDGVIEHKVLSEEEYQKERRKEKNEKQLEQDRKKINKMIVIDVKNQTQGVFEKNKDDDIWELISYTVVTTGRDDGRDSYETPLGHFLVQNTVKQVIFPYKSKVVEKIYDKEGNKIGERIDVIRKYSRANYGIRFSGGGYLHGMPLTDDLVKSLGTAKKVKERKKINEKILGTYRASHKCVRSPEEYEHFLYHDFVGYKEEDSNKWWRKPKELVAVIVY